MALYKHELRQLLEVEVVRAAETAAGNYLKPGVHALAYETFGERLKHPSHPELIIDVIVVVSQRQTPEHIRAHVAFQDALAQLSVEDAHPESRKYRHDEVLELAAQRCDEFKAELLSTLDADVYFAVPLVIEKDEPF